EEIAHEVNRPAGTVRVQLHRGLKRLRRLLPAGFALGGAAGLSSPRGLAAIRAPGLGRAGTLAKAGGGGGGASIAGGALVGKKVALAIGLILVAFGLWRAVSRSPLLSRAQSQPERRLQLDSVSGSSSDSAPPTLSEVGEKSSRSAPESSRL